MRSKQHRERRLRILTVFVVLAVLIGTPVLSMTIFSVSDRSGTVIVEPGSYYAMHFAFYGMGMLSYSFTGVSGEQTTLYELDRKNFERLADGKSYTYTGAETIGFGGSGQTTAFGFMWDEYLVLVNDGLSPAEITYEVDAASYFNLVAAGIVLALSVSLAYGAWKISSVSEETAVRSPPTREQLKVRREAIAAIVLLLAIPFVVLKAIDLLLPPPNPTGPTLFVSPFLWLYVGGLTATALAFALKFRLGVVEGEPKRVLAGLAHELRVSGFPVVEKKSFLSVQTSKFSTTKLISKGRQRNTLIRFQADTTPSGWTVIVLLLVLGFTIPIALIIALYILYRSAAFATAVVLPTLSSSALSGIAESQLDTRAILIDSLSEGRRLSSEAYAAEKSNYEDAIIIFVVVGILLAMVLALALVSFSAAIALVVGLVSAVLFSVLSWRLLARRTRPKLKELKSWSSRFESAFSREMASQSPPDGEPSSFELVAESLMEAPKWLKILGKSGMLREPGYWLLIIFLSLSAAEWGLAGVVSLLGGSYSFGFVGLLITAIFLLCSWMLYGRWKKIRDEEYTSTLGDLAARNKALKAEMESYLRDV